jgi:hypothetical protein
MRSQDLDHIRFVTRHFHGLQGLKYWVPIGLITLSGGGTVYFSKLPLVLFRNALFVGALLLMMGAWRYYKAFGEVERLPSVQPALEMSIFSPAGPTPRPEGLQRMTPLVQRFLITMGLALALFFILHAISPRIGIEEDESLVQPPWLTLHSVLISGEPSSPLWPASASTTRAVFGEMMYALYGSFFLAVWLWRERRLSQSYYLVLGALLLGISAVGASLGLLVLKQELAQTVQYVLPALHLWVALLLCGSSMVLAGLLDHWQLIRALGRPGASWEDGQ